MNIIKYKIVDAEGAPIDPSLVHYDKDIPVRLVGIKFIPPKAMSRLPTMEITLEYLHGHPQRQNYCTQCGHELKAGDQ
jgi:hypothetical protein